MFVSVLLHNHNEPHVGGILFPSSQLPVTSTDVENHTSYKNCISVLFPLCIQTRRVSARLYGTPRNSHVHQVLAPLEQKSGQLFTKSILNHLFLVKNRSGAIITCSGFRPGGTHAYSSKAQPESSSEVEFLWKSNMSFVTVFSISRGITVTMCSSWEHLQ